MEKQKPEDSTQNQKSSGQNRRVGRSALDIAPVFPMR